MIRTLPEEIIKMNDGAVFEKPWDRGPLHVSENGRYLMNGDTPFFWLGDTAWLIFQKLSYEEAYWYLRNRKEKKYNVIQATMMHLESRNNVKYADFRSEAYWERVDTIIRIAEELGLYIAALPCWGYFGKDGRLNPETAPKFAEFLYNRYKDAKNIIWVTGGDVMADVALDTYKLFGSCLRKYFPDSLITYHPDGRTTSSYWLHEEPWLDFNMFQSGHRRYDQEIMRPSEKKRIYPFYGEDNWKYVEHDLALKPQKPTIDAEPSYEWILQGLSDPAQPYWQAWDVRRFAYWSVFEGAFGHTYGDNSIMQYFENGQDPETASFGAFEGWTDTVHHEGSGQMTHLYDLMTSVDFTEGRANDSRIVGGQKEKYSRIAVFETPEYILAYSYLGEKFALSLPEFKKPLQAWWMDPGSGMRSYFGTVSPAEAVSFLPAKKYTGANDWVLILKK